MNNGRSAVALSRCATCATKISSAIALPFQFEFRMAYVYLDHNATTPLDEGVLVAMMPFLRECYGNASSRHEFGTVTRKAVERAREQVAALVGVEAPQVVFTSGGTEANNLFI